MAATQYISLRTNYRYNGRVYRLARLHPPLSGTATAYYASLATKSRTKLHGDPWDPQRYHPPYIHAFTSRVSGIFHSMLFRPNTRLLPIIFTSLSGLYKMPFSRRCMNESGIFLRQFYRIFVNFEGSIFLKPIYYSWSYIFFKTLSQIGAHKKKVWKLQATVNYILEIATHIAQNIAETCQKYFQSFIATETLSQHFF